MFLKQINFFKNSWFLYKDFPGIVRTNNAFVNALWTMKTNGYSDLQITKDWIFLQGKKIVKFEPWHKINHNYFLYAIFLSIYSNNNSILGFLTEKIYNYVKHIMGNKEWAEVDIEELEKEIEKTYENRWNSKELKSLIKKILSVFQKYEVPFYPKGYKAEQGEANLIRPIESEYYDRMYDDVKLIVDGLYRIKEAEELFYNTYLYDFEEKKFFDFSFKKNINGTNYSFRGVMDVIEGEVSFTIRLIWEPLPIDNLFVYSDAFVKNDLLDIFSKKEGLIIVSWPTGSGKTTLLISMLEHMNQHDDLNKVVFTLEDPVEYYFSSKQYFFLQKNVWKDIKDFEDGIMVSLRKHPDVVMVGETRNTATVNWLLTASETWHLAISTLHLTHPRDVITRIKSLAWENKDMVLNQLSKSLIAIINVNLLKVEKEFKDQETGEIKKQIVTVPYYEILKNSPITESIIGRGDVSSLKNMFFEVQNINKGVSLPRELYLLRLNQKYPELFPKEVLERITDAESLEDMENKYAHIGIFRDYE